MKIIDRRGLKPVFEVMMFSCKFWEISKKNSFTELLQATGSGIWNLGQKIFMPLWSVSTFSVKNKNVTEAAIGDVLKKGVLKSFTNFTENTCVGVSFQ